MAQDEKKARWGVKFKGIWEKWKIPVVAVILVLLIFLQIVMIASDYRHRDWWYIWREVAATRTTMLWLMVGVAIFIPVEKVKEVDKLYAAISKLPVELVAVGTFILWMMIHSHLRVVVNHINDVGRIMNWGTLFSYQNVRMVYILGLFLVALTLLGYLICYLKAIYLADWKYLKEVSLLVKIYLGFLTVDLKQGQNMRILIALFAQPLIILLLVLLAASINSDDPLPIFILILITYILLLFLLLRYKAAKIRKHYVTLLDIVQEIADGNIHVKIPAHLGYFDSLKDELITIGNGLNHAVERALVSERMKGDLITNVSHDLKTPLTSIITYVDLLQVEGLTDEKRTQYLETLALKTERLKTLIEDLFEVSKASSGNLQLDMREVDVVTLMKQTILGLEDRIIASDLVLREGYPDEPVKLTLDGARIHRVFENLLINILKYAMPKTRAYIDILTLDEQVSIIMRNISAHEINVDVFDLSERFVRGEASRTTEGSGLGLAIAKSFVQLQGGTFEIVVDGDLFKVIMTFALAKN